MIDKITKEQAFLLWDKLLQSPHIKRSWIYISASGKDRWIKFQKGSSTIECTLSPIDLSTPLGVIEVTKLEYQELAKKWDDYQREEILTFDDLISLL